MNILRSAPALLLVLLLTACMPAAGPADTDGGTSSSSEMSSVASRPLTAEGTLQNAGVGIYMQGSHQLVFDSGEMLLLESETLNLGSFVGGRVIVSGQARATVEAGGTIMNVETIERVAMENFSSEEMLVETSSSSMTSAAMSSVPSSAAASSTMSQSAAVSSAARSPTAISSISSVSHSGPMALVSSSSSPPDASASVKAMSKVSADTANYTTKYCTGYIGFCVPMHKYWFYQSFGANVPPALWNVEVSNQEVRQSGDGVILVRLMPGGLAAEESEGVAVEQENNVIAQRQWTGNRHFEIFGPTELKAAIEFMANGIEVYQVE